jgi:hypothetical protein
LSKEEIRALWDATMKFVREEELRRITATLLDGGADRDWKCGTPYENPEAAPKPKAPLISRTGLYWTAGEAFKAVVDEIDFVNRRARGRILGWPETTVLGDADGRELACSWNIDSGDLMAGERFSEDFFIRVFIPGQCTDNKIRTPDKP